MRIYLADRDIFHFSKVGPPRVLMSYYYFQKYNFTGMLNHHFPYEVDIFADSGAFSAYSKNELVSIDSYISWVYRNKKYFTTYANLDVIGNQIKTRENQKIMEDAGLSPIPVFHIGSAFSELRKLCDDYEYIAIGGMVPYMKKAQQIWKVLVKIFEIADGTKLHGFGCTNFKVMVNFDWYSLDSTTWLTGVKFGEVSFFDPISKSLIRLSANDWKCWRKYRRSIEYMGFNWKQLVSSRTLDKDALLNFCANTFYLLERERSAGRI